MKYRFRHLILTLIVFVIPFSAIIVMPPCRAQQEGLLIPIQWTAKANLPLSHRNGKAVAACGKIYFMGGYCPETEEERETSNFEYDPRTDSWTAKAKMPIGRSNFAVAAFGRRIFVIGGDPVLPNNDLYVKDEDRWRKLAPLSFPRQHIDGARIGHKIYVVGGVIKDPQAPEDAEQQVPRRITPTVEIYDIDENRWDMGLPLPEARHGVQVAAVGGKLYAIGGAFEQTTGRTISSAFARYDPESNTWVSLSGLPFPILAPGIAVVGEKIFVVGGSTIENGTRTASKKVCFFDTGKRQWGTGTPLPKRIQFPGVTAIDDRIYVIGGCDEEFNAYDSVYEGIPTNKSPL